MHTSPSVIRRFSLVFTAIAVTALSGCATSQQAYLADSTTAQRIECNGVFGSWDSCRTEAAAACGETGYQVISRNHIDGLSEAQADQRAAGQSFRERNMLIQCGDGSTRLASLTSKSGSSTEL